MTDNEVLDYFNKSKNIKWENRDITYIEYLLNRFDDFTVCEKVDKCKEALYRLKHNIETCPLCENCGNSLKYLVKYKFYESACSPECKHILANKRLSQTSYKKYGTKRPSQSLKVKAVQKDTNNKKYNASSPLCNNLVREKAIQTLVNKYNTENIAKSNVWKEKVKRTSLEKYGTLYPNQSNIVKEKIKESLILHYGVDNYFKTDIAKQRSKSAEAKIKAIETKRKNKSFNTSKIEKDTFFKLREIYPDVIYQYKDKDRYPFSCDFYIPSLDLFIECNYHWTHGGKPYENTAEDNKKLNSWKEKHTLYYDNAILCWTVRDVNKRNIAIKNNLNYIEFWSLEDFNLWLKKQ